jgi:diguanylate cyclase (GGDEF)-like protein
MSWSDTLLQTIAIPLNTPAFWLALVLLLIGGYRWHWQRLSISQRHRLDDFFQHCPTPAWFADADFCLRQFNPALGLAAGQLGKTPAFYLSPACQQLAWPEVRAELAEYHYWRGLVWSADMSGLKAYELTITQVDPQQPLYLVLQQDVSQQQQLQHTLAELSTHDALSGLPNRALWQAQLQSQLRQAQAGELEFAIALLQMSDLVKIRQQFGQGQSEEYCKWVSQQLRHHLPVGCELGQWSEDQFALLISSQHCLHQPALMAEQLARQCQVAVHGPCQVGEVTLHVRLHVGIAAYPSAGKDCETLLLHAGHALQQSQQDPRGVKIWHQAGQPDSTSWQLATDLQQALSQYQFELFYQVAYQLANRQLQALTVKICWHSPQHGSLWLAQFRNLAEHNHLLLAIERWSFQQLCQHMWQWQQQGAQLPKFRLELSTLQLQQPDLVAFLQHHLQEWHLSPQHFELLLTEQYWLQQPVEALKQLHALQQAGFALIWQGYGSGVCALQLLQQGCWSGVMLSTDVIAPLELLEKERNTCASLIRLAHYQQLQVYADGIDNEMQGYLLNVMGCHSGSGALFGKALTMGQARQLLAGQDPDHAVRFVS